MLGSTSRDPNEALRALSCENRISACVATQDLQQFASTGQRQFDSLDLAQSQPQAAAFGRNARASAYGRCLNLRSTPSGSNSSTSSVSGASMVAVTRPTKGTKSSARGRPRRST